LTPAGRENQRIGSWDSWRSADTKRQLRRYHSAGCHAHLSLR
jgi:hypothetical protein